MTDSKAFGQRSSERIGARRGSHPVARPTPLRALSESETSSPESNTSVTGDHSRTKSTYGPVKWSRAPNGTTSGSKSSSLFALQEDDEQKLSQQRQKPKAASGLSPTSVTPERETRPVGPGSNNPVVELLFDFSHIDYELQRARCIGKGLWSTVYLAHPASKSPQRGPVESPTTASTFQQPDVLSYSLFAIKLPARPDAKDIFSQEARTLTRLQQSANARQYIVAFYGLDVRNSSLVFEGVIGGSLEDLSKRLKVMTELSRHLELRQLFPGLANDLIAGLRFIHAAAVVHADIKPANILLDISDEYEQPVLRARYIDFSASFVPGQDSAVNAGGTWDFMAPEQMRIQVDLSTPTFASDVWSIGIALLSIIVGGSPYAAACGGNAFMLREAVKTGDPLGFARMDPVVQKRLAACQDFVDCCRLALQKDRDRRATAPGWEEWLRRQAFGM